MTTTGKACIGRNKRGEPCSASPAGDSAYCFFHDPARRVERAEGRRKGGQARHGRKVGKPSTPGAVSLRTMGELLTILEQEAAHLLGLERSVSRTRALVSLVDSAGRLLANHEFEQRLQALEEVLHARRHA